MSRTHFAVLRLFVAATVTALTISPAFAGWQITDRAELLSSPGHLQDIVASRDGMGGMLLAAVDQEPIPDRLIISRVDHTGTEVWGDNGVWLPINIEDEWNSWPVAVTHDGNGGGFFAFRAGRGTFELLRLAYVAADGTTQWIVSIDNLGVLAPGDSPRVQLVPTADGEVIVVFERTEPTLTLHSARVDASGTILWHGPVNLSWSVDTHYVARSDGQDGAIVGFFRDGVPDEIRLQRLQGSDGARLWGSDGALVWSGAMGSFEDVVRDASGGAYIVRSANGIAYAQHVSSAGSKLWPADLLVHDTQTAYLAWSSQPRICTDGAGGFILFHGVEDMYAQRVDASGTRLWGANGVTVATAVMIGLPRAIDADGTGGALVSYTTSWLISGTTYCRQVDAARIGALGAILWDEILDFCEYTSPGGVPDIQTWPETVFPFSDGSAGGGIFAWIVHDPDLAGDRWVWGQGIDATGNPPTPRLSYLLPDAAEPGQTGPYVILGDYLDLSLDWTLQKEDGLVSLPLTPDLLHSYQMLEGTATLSGLTRGAYHLIVQREGVAQDTLQYAAGIGFPLPCGDEGPLLAEPRDVRVEGSQRQAVYTSDGRLHVVWIEFDPMAPGYSLELAYRDDTWHRTESPYRTTAPLSDPTMARDDLDRLHIMFVEEVDPSQDLLVYLRIDPSGEISLVDRYDPGQEVHDPVVAVVDNGTVHVAFEQGAYPANQLWHWVHDGNSFLSGWRPTTAPGPHDPDLCAVGNALELVYVDDGGAFGLQQVQRARFETHWDAPQLLSFGVGASSPSVAYDGESRLLYAWVLDNEIINGIPPLVHTRLRVGEDLEPAHPRPGMTVQHLVSVAAAAPQQFLMLTTESEGGPNIGVFVREGNGRVFFPRVHANAGSDVGIARIAAQRGNLPVTAYWRGFDDPSLPLLALNCQRTATAAPNVAPIVDRSLRARPNPFNPGTVFVFELPRATTVELVVYDLRGRAVRHLHRGFLASGPQAIAWDGRDDRGAPVASAAYVARLDRGDGTVSVRKIALLK
jgi:hypothetical protein